VASLPDDAGLTEGRGKWVLSVGGGTVTQIRIDHAFTLLVESWLAIRISTRFTYGPPGDPRWFEPSDAARLAPLLTLHQATVTSAEIQKDGQLTVVFTDGAVLSVLPDDQFEAFTVTGDLPPIRREFTFVARPGGGLARL
jgi:hypothetical protein